MSKVGSAYAYYMATYANQEVSRYDSHKKSDLRRVYNNIIRTNKESPLYKIPNEQNAAKYAIDIKEHAKHIQNVVASLSDRYGSTMNSFQKKVAASSNENMVSVRYIGDGHENNPAEQFDIEVQQLASPQNNMGNYLPDQKLSFIPGNYSFDLNTTNSAYEFQYSVNPEESNLDILNKLANLVNNAGIRLTAEVISDKNGSSALSVTSNQTGLTEDENALFTISPAADSGSMAAMDLLGIHNVTSPAYNSRFLINGKEHSSLSNTFTVNNVFELTLKNVSDGTVSTIGFKNNSEAVSDNIQNLVDVYNSMIDTARSNFDNNASDGTKLYNDLSAASRNHRIELGNIGLMVDEAGTITINKNILAESITSDRAEDTFQTLTRFRDSIGNKANSAAINPMQYVNKIIVAYKNPGHNFVTPYISSIYSGMLLDNYV